MRKLVLLTTALFGLALPDLSFAQPSQSGPQPGLPPGASIGAPNAVQPSPTGQVTTTPTAPAAPMASAPVPYNPPPARTTRRRRVRRHRAPAHARHAAPATTDGTTTNQ